ncbi:MAG: prepilin peptidase [Pseudomonadota bacterium]
MLATPALIAATAVLVPLMLLACYIDFKEMRIPNWLVLAVVALFLVTGAWGLPLDVYLWRIGYGVIALVIVYLFFEVVERFFPDNVGAGDLKLIAALVPFVAPFDAADVLILYALLSIVGLFLHQFARALLRGRETGFKSLDQKLYFPVGLVIGLTMCVYYGVATGKAVGWITSF